MTDTHLESPSDCVTALFADHHDGLHQHPVEAQVAVDLAQSDMEAEPPVKRLRSADDVFTETITIDWNDDNVKQTLYNVNRALTLRLDDLERKYDTLLKTVQTLNKKLQLKDNEKSESNRGRGNAVVVGLPQNGTTPVRNAYTAPGGNVTLITLNNENDYPNGVWLGNETDPEMRVRVPISPSDLLHIHSNCRTPEKMALTLLDYLFDRDIQATSNLSGTGKHGKMQLDPLKIYGIRCHLIHKFGVKEREWHRIRLNIDSKCRTAYRRKMRGQPMVVKGFRDQKDHEFVAYTTSNLHDDSQLQIQEGLSLDGSGELQIIHATEEQLVQLQQTHQIQILDDNQVSAELLQQLHNQSGVHGQGISVTDTPVDLCPNEQTDHTPVDYGDASAQLRVNESEINEEEPGSHNSLQ
ncbi:protein BANP-like [Watersipora subatra]|uniref:protein BANP-like n=1 Tax=Watersipora subatra TaxID=2589382 RepID=UPI00355C39DC